MQPEMNTAGLGVTGLKRAGGTVTEEWLLDLRGREGMRRYREMRDNSAILGACFEAIEKLFRQFRFEWEPADESPKAVQAAKLLNESFDDLDTPIADVIESNLSMLTFGWDLKERILKRRAGAVDDPTQSSKYSDGLWTWGAFAERAQESTAPFQPWELSPNGARLIAWSQVDERGLRKTIPAANLLHFRTKRAKNNPEGRSALRNCWFSWYFFKRITEAEAIGISRDLTGIPVAKVAADWFSPEAKDWEKATLDVLRNDVITIARGENEGLVWPMAYDQNGHSLFEIELLSSGGKRQFDTSAIAERYERRMAMVMLSDVLLMGHEATGSFALSDTKTNILEIAVKAIARIVAEVYQADAPLIMRLNGWPAELSPRLCAKTPKEFDLGPLGDFVSKICAAGFNWRSDPGIDRVLREAAGLPKATEGIPTADPAPVTPAAQLRKDDLTTPAKK